MCGPQSAVGEAMGGGRGGRARTGAQPKEHQVVRGVWCFLRGPWPGSECRKKSNNHRALLSPSQERQVAAVEVWAGGAPRHSKLVGAAVAPSTHLLHPATWLQRSHVLFEALVGAQVCRALQRGDGGGRVPNISQEGAVAVQRIGVLQEGQEGGHWAGEGLRGQGSGAAAPRRGWSAYRKFVIRQAARQALPSAIVHRV